MLLIYMIAFYLFCGQTCTVIMAATNDYFHDLINQFYFLDCFDLKNVTKWRKVPTILSESPR